MTGRILPNLLQQQTVVPLFPEPRRRGRVPKFSEAQLRAAVADEKSDDEIAAEFNCSKQWVALKRAEFGLKSGRRANGKKRSSSRFEPRVATERSATMPPVDHPALVEDRTIYPSTVVPVEGLQNALVSGVNHWKIGGTIKRGKWEGFPVFALTLEERATCPVSCRHWRSCYGNRMHLAKRVMHGDGLEERLEHELALLQYRNPNGFAVRLHVLGDFYSVDYVQRWAGFLDRFPALNVFGFTARVDAEQDPIARELVNLVLARWERFAIRFSNAPVDECSTVSIEHPRQLPDDAVLCPQQTGKTDSCSTCALCWQSRRRIAFLQH